MIWIPAFAGMTGGRHAWFPAPRFREDKLHGNETKTMNLDSRLHGNDEEKIS